MSARGPRGTPLPRGPVLAGLTLAGLLLAGLTLAGLGACSLPPSGPPPSGSVPPSGSASSGASGAAPVGRAIYQSDVQTIPDRAIPSAVVLAVPAASVADFWRAVGLTDAGPAFAGKLELTVPASAPAVAVPIVDGRFPVPPDAAGGLLCLAPDAAAGAPPPHRVVGCVTLPSPVPAEVTLAYGIAGVSLA